MMTLEEVLSIEEYCAEHKISHKKRPEELEIPFWNFYKAKQKYRKEDEQDAQPGQFVQKRRQEESYKIIQEFENWMNSVSNYCIKIIELYILCLKFTCHCTLWSWLC